MIGRPPNPPFFPTPPLSRPPVPTRVAGNPPSATTTASRVGVLLAEQGVLLHKDAQVWPRLSGAVSPGLTVALVRVSRQRSKATQPVPFGTTKRSTSDLFVGQSRVVTKGKAGSRTVVYDVLVKNGKAADKTVVSSTQTTAPVDRVLEVGAKKRAATTSSSRKSGGNVGGGGGRPHRPAPP